jgi:hypothetical protein
MAPKGAQLLEEALRNNLSDALVHCFEDGAELACVDEPDSTPACENGKVVAERMDVEEKSSWLECSMDLTQDVHDVLRFNSSE